MNEEIVSDPEKKKNKTVQHKLEVMKQHPIRGLTQFVVLDAFDPDPKHTSLFKAYDLQRRLRTQYYRLVKSQSDRRRKLTYCINCRPTGFTVSPWTMACRGRRVCPWCYVRRLYTGYQELMTVDAKIRNLHSLLAWRREVPATDKLPFFNTQYGPHQWCEATRTLQYVIPKWNVRLNELTLLHVGFQAIPKDFDYESALTRRAVNPSVRMRLYPKYTSSSAITALSEFTRLDWRYLVYHKHFFQFATLHDWNPGAKLFRVSGAQPKGENRGD